MEQESSFSEIGYIDAGPKTPGPNFDLQRTAGPNNRANNRSAKPGPDAHVLTVINGSRSVVSKADGSLDALKAGLEGDPVAEKLLGQATGRAFKCYESSASAPSAFHAFRGQIEPLDAPRDEKNIERLTWDVRRGMASILSHPWIPTAGPEAMTVRGFIYDVDIGHLEEVSYPGEPDQNAALAPASNPSATNLCKMLVHVYAEQNRRKSKDVLFEHQTFSQGSPLRSDRCMWQPAHPEGPSGQVYPRSYER